MEAIHAPKTIRELRDAAGLTQEKLAEAAGVHRVSLARYETGDAAPGGPALQRIAAALGVSASDISLTERRRAS